jgi:hypothetical protein
MERSRQAGNELGKLARAFRNIYRINFTPKHTERRGISDTINRKTEKLSFCGSGAGKSPLKKRKRFFVPVFFVYNLSFYERKANILSAP